MKRPVPIPELKKDISPIPQLGSVSVLKKENVLLTESIEMAHRK